MQERPEIIGKQERMGDMKMDLILEASPNEAILTMVDRKIDYIFIIGELNIDVNRISYI